MPHIKYSFFSIIAFTDVGNFDNVKLENIQLTDTKAYQEQQSFLDHTNNYPQ